MYYTFWGELTWKIPCHFCFSNSKFIKNYIKIILSVQFSSVAQSCLTLCNPIDCSTSGFPVHHQLPEVPQTHVHRTGDAIQSSRNLLFPSPPSFNLPSFRVSSNDLVLCIRWPKHWSFSFSISPSNEYSGLISFRID